MEVTVTQIYPFLWLDELVEVTLNPSTRVYEGLSDKELKSIKDRLPVEIRQVEFALKTQAFSLYVNEQIGVVAGQYDRSLEMLRRQAVLNLQRYPGGSPVYDLGLVILRSLENLIEAVRERYEYFLPFRRAKNGIGDTPNPAGGAEKVLCGLSADQVGVILRAAFEARVILGKSFRKVCQVIAPFIATPWKDTISWDTIRSISGRAERRDKEVAIEFLEKMVVKIRDL